MRTEPTVTRLAAEHRDGLGLGVAEPRLSWVVEAPDGWRQARAEATVDGVTHALPTPFTVVATQNPFDMEGTYALPEAQRDRFMARISMGYPDRAAELATVRDRDTSNPMDRITPVVNGGNNGEADRRALWAVAKGVLCL